MDHEASIDRIQSYRVIAVLSLPVGRGATAGGVAFQLRAWTERYEDWAQVCSDLAVAIKEALTGEKIGIV